MLNQRPVVEHVRHGLAAHLDDLPDGSSGPLSTGSTGHDAPPSAPSTTDEPLTPPSHEPTTPEEIERAKNPIGYSITEETEEEIEAEETEKGHS